MNLLRVCIFLYIVMTPFLLFTMSILTFRTRNIILVSRWLRQYVLPTLILSALMIVNIGLLFRLYPSTVSHIDIECVSRNDLSQDVTNPIGQGFVGLINIGELDYIAHANVFDPEIVGYTNALYYPYQLVAGYLGEVDEAGLLRISQQQDAWLMEDYPCAPLEDGMYVDEGTYLVYLDQRAESLPYVHGWYNQAVRVFSYVLIEEYDEDVSYAEQKDTVKEEITYWLSLLPSE